LIQQHGQQACILPFTPFSLEASADSMDFCTDTMLDDELFFADLADTLLLLPPLNRVPPRHYKVITTEIDKAALSFQLEKVPKGSRRAAPKLKKKDPNRPRGYISAFNYFAKEHRPRVAISVTASSTLFTTSAARNNAINKEVGREWHSMSAPQRAQYEALAVKDKTRYLTEMTAYRPTAGYEREAPRYVTRAEMHI
jgi:HMG (high mobility group) box